MIRKNAFHALLTMAGMLLPAMAFAQEPMIPAQLVASQYTTLSAELPGKIDSIAVKEGDRFTADQVLIAFDCSLQKAALDEARAVLVAAEKSKAAHKRLLELKSTGSLEVGKAVADAAVAAAKANSAQAVVSKCTIRAPFSGLVAERKVQAYQYVQAGQELLDILDDSALEAEFIVPSAWAPKLKEGMGVDILVDETGEAYPATIVRVGAKVDSVSHSVKVIAEIKGEFPELMAGMTGKVRMTPR
jgi:RND family efflux transporter MFP subunit